MPDEHAHPKTVKIFIDKEKRETPEHTSGHALYALGPVKEGFDLYLEVPGPKPDQLIPDDASKMEAKEGAHFYTVKRNLNPGHD
jgi:hypothetical protein